MPTEIRVVNFTNQAGQTEAAARAALLALDPDVLIETVGVYNPAVVVGIVISQVVTSIAIEAAGGPVGSHGTKVVLTVSASSIASVGIITNLIQSRRGHRQVRVWDIP